MKEYKVYRWRGFQRQFWNDFDTEREAIRYLRELYTIVSLDRDEDSKLITLISKTGTQYTIEWNNKTYKSR